MRPQMAPGAFARPGARTPAGVAARPAAVVRGGYGQAQAVGIARSGAAMANGGVIKAAAPAAGGAALVVSSQSKNVEIGVQTLVGDYKETGSNHGKKVYQKVQKIAGHENIKVFLYYWDQRDGADFSGWWFGDQVGGTQVWARVSSHGPSPPRVGWRVPWDAAKAEPGVLFVDPAGAGKPAATGVAGKLAPTGIAGKPTATGIAGKLAPTGTAGKPAAAGIVGSAGAASAGSATVGPAALQARVKAAGQKVAALEKAVGAATAASKALNVDSDQGALQAALKELQKQLTPLQQAQKALTVDIAEARKGGHAATGPSTELSKLSQKLRPLQTQVASEMHKVRTLTAKAQAGAANPQKQAETAAANKAAEERDGLELQEILPAAQELVTQCEDALESVHALAAPLTAEPPDESSELLKQAIKDVESSANEAQEKMTEARKDINTKLQAAKKFAPETRKLALGEFSGLQQKLTEAQKRLNPYKAFGKDFQARVAARKHLVELADKLSAAELEAEKATMMSAAAEHGQMFEEEISSAEAVAKPARAAIENALRTIDQKMKAAAEAAMKDELSQMKDKAMVFKKSIDAVFAILRQQREKLSTRDMLKLASDKVDAVEALLLPCQEAEMPFLKGLEILPADESSRAIAHSEDAAKKMEAAVNQARNYIKTKSAEVKKLEKEVAASVTEELTAHQTRLEGASQKLSTFKKETAERKMSAFLAEVVEGISSMETKVEALAKAANIFSAATLDEVSVEDLKTAIEKCGGAEKDASAALLDVRKALATKQKETKGADAAQAFGKLQSRINAAQADVAKTKKAISSGERLVKGKVVLVEEEAKIAEAEDAVKAAERKVKPGKEEAALGIEAAHPSDEDIEAMGAALASAQQTLKQSSRAVEAQAAGAPASLKAPLQQLAERCKAALAIATEVLALTKDQRERVMGAAHVREGQAKVAEVEAAIEKVNDAELPYLKGLEVIPLQEASDAMKACDVAASEVKAAMSAARNFIASKSMEIKQYGQAASKTAQEEFGKLTEQINAAASRLAQFKQDTEGRKRTALMQEASEKAASVEAEVQKLDEYIEPFAREDGGKEESEEAADKMVSQFKATQAAIDEAKRLLQARQKDAAGNAAQLETLKDLSKRMTAASSAVFKHKKIASTHEAKYLAKKAIAEANEVLADVEKEVKNATDAAAPLVEQGGERFLVAASARTLAQAWRDHMRAKGLTHESLFAEIAGGAGGEGIPRDSFIEHLAALPSSLERDEIAFSEARREAIFAHLDEDGDSKLSFAEFKDLFVQRFKVTKEITVTDVFDVAKSKSLCKVVAGEILETLHGSQTDESSRMTRIECTIVSNGTTGFVTMSGNQGTQFVEVVSPFTTFCGELDKNIEVSMKAVQKLAGAFTAKQQELAACKDAPLVEARAELTKLKHTLAAGQQSLQKLKVTVAQEKKAYMAKELKEKNAHIEAKERKAAEALTSPAIAKVEAMDASLAALEEAVKTLVSLSKDELVAFITPLSIHQTADRLADEVSRSVDAAKEAIAAQQGELPKEVKGPMAEAKRELMKMTAKAEQVKKKGKSTLDAVKSKCQHIADACAAEISGAMRTEMLAKGLSVEAYFLQLVTAGDETISHEAFCRHVEGLVGEAYKAEHVSLLCRQIEAGAIGRRRFQAFLQQYFVVVKGIAITDEFPISTAKTLRKAEADEVIELLEGPKADDKLGMSRIRGKSLVDNLEGWISLKGNQGTPFLTEVEKPFLTCSAELALDSEFKSEGQQGAVRTLAADEVLELLEGPRKQTFSAGLRVRGKAISDGAMGWFTARDQHGTVFAEADGKYYSCTAPVAITDGLEIKDCKVLRKLAVGELFTLEEGPLEDAGVMRVKGKCLKDDTVGWVTTKGNAGTQFAEASSKHFCVLEEVALTKLFPTARCGEEVRKLVKGEAIQVLEGPKEEAYAPELRVKVRALSDGVVGWITRKQGVVKPWTPFYTCKAKTQLQDTLSVEGATAVRDVEVGERLELIEGPCRDGKTLRIKAKADKDGAVGWVTVKDSGGKAFFTS